MDRLACLNTAAAIGRHEPWRDALQLLLADPAGARHVTVRELKRREFDQAIHVLVPAQTRGGRA